MDHDRASAMLDEARAELVTARSSISYLEQVVSGLEGLLRTKPLPTPPRVEASDNPGSESVVEGDATEQDNKLYPKSIEAVETVLRSRPNQPMRFPAVWQQIVAAGLNDPSIKSGINAYQNAGRRLAKDRSSAVELDEQGRYIYRTDSPAAAPRAIDLFPPNRAGGGFLTSVGADQS